MASGIYDRFRRIDHITENKIFSKEGFAKFRHCKSPKRICILFLLFMFSLGPFEPSHEIMTRFVLRKLILQTRMHSHPVGLDVWFFGRIRRLVPYFMCANSDRRLAWAFAGRPYDKLAHFCMAYSQTSAFYVQRFRSLSENLVVYRTFWKWLSNSYVY